MHELTDGTALTLASFVYTLSASSNRAVIKQDEYLTVFVRLAKDTLVDLLRLCIEVKKRTKLPSLLPEKLLISCTHVAMLFLQTRE